MERKLTAEQIAAFRLLGWRELKILRRVFPDVIEAWRSHPDAPISDWNMEAIELEMFRASFLKPGRKGAQLGAP
jgi:hypothetical protein